LAVQYTKDVATVLQGVSSAASGGMDVTSTFTQIKGLMEEKKARKAYALAKEMDDMALTMMEKANRMTKILTDAAQEVVPENVREELNMESNNNNTRGVDNNDSAVVEDEEASALVDLLGHADSDVEEVKTNTRSMEQTDNIFTASNTKDAFSKVADKEDVAVKIFAEIKSVSDSIVDTLVVTSGARDASLCAQFMAAATGVEALFKALRLSQLIQRALDTVRRILEAFMGFINTSWDKFQHFFDQFDAGKKLEQLADGLKQKVGNKLGKVFG